VERLVESGMAATAVGVLRSVEIKPEHRRIWDFISQGVPPGGTPQFKKWREDVRKLGPDAPKIFIQAMREGDEAEQYTAVWGLRYFGYESHGEGYGPELIYKHRAPGQTEWVTILPYFPPDEDY
jgi:hypothetical protein